MTEDCSGPIGPAQSSVCVVRSRFRFATVAGGAVVLALAAACNPDLNVTNPNQPDVARAISSGSDVRQLIGSSYNSMYLAMQGCAKSPCQPNPGIATGVMGDVFTMAFGNFGARFNGQEPRLAYNNSSAAGDGLVASQPYDALYGALGAANDGLKAIKNSVRVAATPSSADETPKLPNAMVKTSPITPVAIPGLGWQGDFAQPCIARYIELYELPIS